MKKRRTDAALVGPPTPPDILSEPSIFNDARCKLFRAEMHAHDISRRWERLVEYYTDPANRGEFKTPDGSQYAPWNIPMDLHIPLLIGDCLRNTRSALDYLTSALAREAGISDQRIMFPFNEKPDQVLLAFKPPQQRERGNIKELRKVFAHYPNLKEIIMEDIQPFSQEYGARAGGDLLWRVVTADNLDKHRLITPTVQGGFVENVRFGKTGRLTNMQFIGPPGFITFPADIEFNADNEFTVNLLFEQPTRLTDRPVTSTLVEAINEVRIVIDLFEDRFGHSGNLSGTIR